MYAGGENHAGRNKRPYICLFTSNLMAKKSMTEKALAYGVDECIFIPIFKAEMHRLLLSSQLLNSQ